MRRKQLEFELLYLYLYLRHSQKEEIVSESIICLLYRCLYELSIKALHLRILSLYLNDLTSIIDRDIFFSTR